MTSSLPEAKYGIVHSKYLEQGKAQTHIRYLKDVLLWCYDDFISAINKWSSVVL